MKKILILFFLVFISSFSNMNTPYEIESCPKSWIAGNDRTVFTLISYTYKITGLGNTEIKYEIIGDRKLYKINGSGEIDLKNIDLDTVNGLKDNDRLKGNGRIDFKIRAKALKNGCLERGIYTSKNLYLKITSVFLNKIVYIPIRFEVNILESIKIKTKDMDFGTQILGEKVTTKSYGATPGEVEVTGEPGTYFNLEYPKEVELRNRNKSDAKVKVLLANSEGTNIMIPSSGKTRLKIEGSIENTNFLDSGEYEGEVKIKVRYDF